MVTINKREGIIQFSIFSFVRVSIYRNNQRNPECFLYISDRKSKNIVFSFFAIFKDDADPEIYVLRISLSFNDLSILKYRDVPCQLIPSCIFTPIPWILTLQTRNRARIGCSSRHLSIQMPAAPFFCKNHGYDVKNVNRFMLVLNKM